MEMNEILLRIKKLMEERGWTIYRLAKESGIPYSSLNSLFQKNNQPTISTLEKLCGGLHLNLQEFFSEVPPYREHSFDLKQDELELVELYRSLNLSERKTLITYVKGYSRKPL